MREQEDVLLLAHAAGVSPRAGAVDAMLRRWSGEVAAALGIADPSEDAKNCEEVEKHSGRLAQQRAPRGDGHHGRGDGGAARTARRADTGASGAGWVRGLAIAASIGGRYVRRARTQNAEFQTAGAPATYPNNDQPRHLHPP